MTTELKCTSYVQQNEYPEHTTPCQCPICGGFLKWEGEELNIPKCNKCRTELIMLPDFDEETHEKLDWGRICPMSKPKERKSTS